MLLCVFIRHTADGNRIARTGSLLHVHSEMGRGGRESEKRCVCVFVHIFILVGALPCAVPILRYFLSALTQLYTHTPLFLQLCCSALVHL